MRPSIGATGTFITGWALFVGVIGIASGSFAGAGFFAAKVLEKVGVKAFNGVTGQVVLDLALLAVAIYVTISSVRTAARVSATLEILSITVIVLVLITVMFKSGHWVDSLQTSLSGAKFNGIVFAIVLAILGFVGFEGAASFAYVFYANIIPVPAPPMNRLPYYFISFLTLGLLWFADLKVRKPTAVELIGTFADDAPIN